MSNWLYPTKDDNTRNPRFAIGVRVRFTRSDKPERTLIGTVKGSYPADYFYVAGKRVEVPETCKVKPDVIPEWWPYPEDDCFCPSIDELEEI